MLKIASVTELRIELRRILDYVQCVLPSKWIRANQLLLWMSASVAAREYRKWDHVTSERSPGTSDYGLVAAVEGDTVTVIWLSGECTAVEAASLRPSTHHKYLAQFGERDYDHKRYYDRDYDPY